MHASRHLSSGLLQGTPAQGPRPSKLRGRGATGLTSALGNDKFSPLTSPLLDLPHPVTGGSLVSPLPGALPAPLGTWGWWGLSFPERLHVHKHAHRGMCLLLSTAQFLKAWCPHDGVVPAYPRHCICPASKLPGRGEAMCCVVSGHGSNQRLSRAGDSGLPRCPLSVETCPLSSWPCSGCSPPLRPPPPPLVP